MVKVDDLIVERQLDDLAEVARCHGLTLERVSQNCIRITLEARGGDIYQLQVEIDGFPALPPAFHWRNPGTGELDQRTDAPIPYNYFHGSNRICAPWNRLASTPGGPHAEDWVHSNWKEQPETRGATTLPAMVQIIHHELRSVRYQGRQQ
ncbi:MAG: hypothetical protein OXH58_04965 [Acidimicrobiaceae bacterium]|nr:hypothetical protein [Acidimicrobiaceae bacterium]